MRFVFLIAICIAGMVAFGWIYLEQDRDSVGVSIDKHKVEKDTNHIEDEVKEDLDAMNDNKDSRTQEATADET